MSGAGGWEQIYPKPRRVPTPGEVELIGGPRDGERRAVPDIDTPLVFGEVGQLLIEPGRLDAIADVAAGPMYVYRRREAAPDEPEPIPIRFDYQVPIPLP